jgi:hypothetical protein
VVAIDVTDAEWGRRLHGSRPTGTSSAMHTHAPGAAERGPGIGWTNPIVSADHQGWLGDPDLAEEVVHPERVGTIGLAECSRVALPARLLADEPSGLVMAVVRF